MSTGEQWTDSRMGLIEPAMDEPALDAGPAASVITDRYAGTSSVGAFPANGYGLAD